MRFAVCIKQVPDTEMKIKLSADSSSVDFVGVKWVVNPYDEHAIEESLKLRDANPGSTIIAFSLGPKVRIVEALRTALAMGVDEAVAIDAPDHIDSSSAAKALATAIKNEGHFDLILTGKLAIDDNSSSVSQMIASDLEIPHITVASKLTLTGSNVTVEREVEGGTREIYDITLPCLVAATKGLNVPRYASLPGIMKAKKKTIKEVGVSSLGYDEKNLKVRYSGYSLPKPKPEVKILTGDITGQAKELARLLRDDAKVI